MIGVDNACRLGDGDLSPVIACLYLTVHSPPKKVDLKILILVNLVENTSHTHLRYQRSWNIGGHLPLYCKLEGQTL